MELKRFREVWGIDTNAADYDSTKANFDELWEKNNALANYVHGQIAELQTDVAEIDEELNIFADDITALEEHRKDNLEDFISFRQRVYKRIPTPEAKDAPEKTADKVIWTLDERGWQWHYGAKEKQPPPTCGNCTKPARWDDDSGSVACFEETEMLLLKHADNPACPHYDRRRA